MLPQAAAGPVWGPHWPIRISLSSNPGFPAKPDVNGIVQRKSKKVMIMKCLVTGMSDPPYADIRNV